MGSEVFLVIVGLGVHQTTDFDGMGILLGTRSVLFPGIQGRDIGNGNHDNHKGEDFEEEDGEKDVSECTAVINHPMKPNHINNNMPQNVIRGQNLS